MAIFCLYHLECSYFKVDFPVYFLYDKGNLITEDENMRDYRKRAERFFLKNRDKGIRNLMLIIAVGNAATYLLSVIDPSRVVYSWLKFDYAAILSGQVWRLFTYIFTYLLDTSGVNLLLSAVALFCYYQFGKILEQYWGSFKFNLYYLCGVLLTDLAGLLFHVNADAGSLNLSLFLAVATIAPEAQVLLFFIIPIKMKYLAWAYLGFTALQVVQIIVSGGITNFAWLFPIFALLNYFLFFGSDIRNVFTFGNGYRRPRPSRPASPRPRANWAGDYQSKSGERPYRHKCTVCGRTDTDYPNLEFRYCSKCNGYYCYCIDHINNHVHIQ